MDAPDIKYDCACGPAPKLAPDIFHPTDSRLSKLYHGGAGLTPPVPIHSHPNPLADQYAADALRRQPTGPAYRHARRSAAAGAGTQRHVAGRLWRLYAAEFSFDSCKGLLLVVRRADYADQRIRLQSRL